MTHSDAAKAADGGALPWTETRLVGLIQDGIEENQSLEYKSAAALGREGRKRAEITKDVSAMANAAGGVLIYGMAEHQNEPQKHLPERLDPVNRGEFSKEWLEQIIGQIRPRIPELKIHPVALKSGPDDVAYVVEIPQAVTAHQASDCKYYRRYNFEAVPMLDHEIRDVMNRKAHPSLLVKARLVVYPQANEDGTCGRLIFDLNNESDVFVRYVALVLHAPLKVGKRLVMYEGANLDETDAGTGYKLSYSNHSEAPLFPRARISAGFSFKLVARMSHEPEKQLDHFRYLVFADSMPYKSGSFTLEEILFRG